MVGHVEKALFAAIAICALIAGTAPAAAQAAGEWKSSAQIWNASCRYCHDEGIGPEILGLHLSKKLIRHTVRNGLNAMPPFFPSEIDARELADLARWVSVHKHLPGKARRP